ncbi:MAG: HU family DNA-binding protein [Blastocatellia bacterium]
MRAQSIRCSAIAASAERHQLDTAEGRSYNARCFWANNHQNTKPHHRFLTVGGTVIKLDIINNVAEKTGVPKMKAEAAVEALFEAMKEAMKRGERIELRGFGVFVVKPRKRGIGRNPRTGTQVAIPEGKTIRFKPGKELQS